MAIEDDKALLSEFVRNVYEWLGVSHENQWYATDAGWPTVRPLAFLRSDAQSAWREFNESIRLERVERAVRELREEQMVANGLFGAQLRYQIRGQSELFILV